jgi:outer membrane protein OmpA-like peptidoglycan-associated protein
VATACKAHKIEIGGHTDSVGKPENNQALSQKRADAVKAYWTAKGVAAAGLVATGFGETKPLEAVGDETANEKNRRIEFTVTAAQ